jgi:hypothetical protein
MVTQSDLVPSQRFLHEVIANPGQAAGVDGRVFRAKGIAECIRDCVRTAVPQPPIRSKGASISHVYEVRPRNDHRGVDLISDGLPFSRLWYNGPNTISNAVDGAKFTAGHIWHGEITFDNDRAL